MNQRQIVKHPLISSGKEAKHIKKDQSTFWIKPFVILILIVTLESCAEQDTFDIPPLLEEQPDIDGTVINPSAILGILAQEVSREGKEAVVAFENTTNYVQGYVISSDKGGNFFKELILQDQASSPTAGIRVLVDTNPLYTSYGFGRKIYIKLDGLSAGIENGVPTLGILAGNEIRGIPSFQVQHHIFRGTAVEAITPKKVSIEDFSDALLHQYISIDNLQITKEQVLGEKPYTFAAEPFDEFTGDRILESCDSRRSTVLSTSTFTDFRGLQLPEGQGSFTGILTKDFFGDAFRLVLNDPFGLAFESPERCDPEVINCIGVPSGDIVIFEETFTGKTAQGLAADGWINRNMDDGELLFAIGNFEDSEYVGITGFNSEESSFDVWLVTPEIDLGEKSEVQLLMDIQASYDNGADLSVWITDDFNDIRTTNWIGLDAKIPIGPSNGFGPFQSIAPINISCITGNIRIGIRYVGGDPGQTTRYHIDNLRVLGKE